jgi:hypothetical protein
MRRPFGPFSAAFAFVLAFAVPLPGFEDTFDSPGVIDEVGSAAGSRSAAWWLTAGGRMTFEDGIARTIQGDLPSDDRWFRGYSRANPRDTDGGLHPQNIFRLVTQETGTNSRLRVSFRVRRTNLSASPERDRFSGVFLFSRYKDPGNDTYAAGLRFDGLAIIKKKRLGTWYTMTTRPIYDGVYDRVANPTLIPEDRWISLRMITEDWGTGVRVVLEVHEPTQSPGFVRKLEVLDVDGGFDGLPIRGPGRAGLRSDFMDLEFDEYLAFGSADHVSERLGYRDDRNARVAIDTVATPDVPLASWTFGASRRGSLPIAGRFTEGPGCGETVGVYEPASGTFFLRFANGGGAADAVFTFGPPNPRLRGIAGDWDGDGVTGVGVYDPDTGAFFLANGHGGVANHAFWFGSGGSGLLPIAGDWDGDGRDTVGLYDPARGAFFLRNEHAGGPADEVFFFGPGGDGLLPIAGDWDGDGIDTVAIFRARDGVAAIRNQHAGGAADRVDVLDGSTSSTSPIGGRWEETCS